MDFAARKPLVAAGGDDALLALGEPLKNAKRVHLPDLQRDALKLRRAADLLADEVARGAAAAAAASSSASLVAAAADLARHADDADAAVADATAATMKAAKFFGEDAEEANGAVDASHLFGSLHGLVEAYAAARARAKDREARLAKAAEEAARKTPEAKKERRRESRRRSTVTVDDILGDASAKTRVSESRPPPTSDV